MGWEKGEEGNNFVFLLRSAPIRPVGHLSPWDGRKGKRGIFCDSYPFRSYPPCRAPFSTGWEKGEEGDNFVFLLLPFMGEMARGGVLYE
jgi:hypothetical protein